MATRIDPLENALRELEESGGFSLPKTAAAIDAAIRSAVKAVLPGRQAKGNVDEYIDTGRKAFVRTLRRRARA